MTTENTIKEIIAAHGPMPRFDLAEKVAEAEKISFDEALVLVNGYTEVVELDGEDVVSGLDYDAIKIYTIDLEPGRETDKDYFGLPVLEDVGHPLVPKLGHEYIPRELDGNVMDIQLAARAMNDPDFASLYIGETGVGKNVLAKHLCEQTNRPQVRVNFGINTTYEKLIGLYVPDEENGGFTWRDGVLTKAVKYGWVFVADEINAAPPEVTVELNAVAEESSARELFVQEKNELLKPHKQFRLVGTMNPNYAGTKDMNKAFKGRFYPFVIPHLPYNENRPESSPEVGILMQKSNLGAHPEGEKIATHLVALAHRMRQQADFESGQTLTTPISTRQLIQAGNLVCDKDGKDFMPPKAAARTIFRGFADPLEWSTIDTVIDRHFPKGGSA